MNSYEEITFVCDMTVSASRSALCQAPEISKPRANSGRQGRKNITISAGYTNSHVPPEALRSLIRIWGCVRFLKFFMTAHPLSFMFDALSNLEKAVEAAAKSIKTAKVQDQAVLRRITSYKEIIRRQHSLLGELKRASAREDWKEVSRITSLVHGSSLMIKVDAGFLISNLKSRNTADEAASH